MNPHWCNLDQFKLHVYGSAIHARHISYVTTETKSWEARVFGISVWLVWNWTTKKSECRRIDAFELWCWRRLLRVPWTARRSNQSILKEINLEYSLERLMVRLKLRYFGHLMWRADSWKRPWCWERLKARGEGDDRGRDGWMASLTQSTWFWASSGWWWKTGKTGVLQSMGSQRAWCDWETEPGVWKWSEHVSHSIMSDSLQWQGL